MAVKEISAMGALYVFFSSTMMIFNKAALRVFPFPMQLTAFQYLVSAASVSVLSLVSLVDAEGLRLAAVRKFWLVSAVFTLAIFSNTRVLHVASVETVIVFRSTVALLTSIGDWIWLGRELPEPRSWASLLVVVAGAAGYMISEGSGVTVDSVAWGTIYVMVLAFEMLYVKHVVTEVEMSTWTRVYYNNMISLGLNMPVIFLSQMQPADSISFLPPAVRGVTEPPLEVAALVALSAVGGLGISYAGFGFRSIVSSTVFTLTGIMCKVLTVLMSQFIFKNSASVRGIACLALCVGGATFYKPSPKRVEASGATIEELRHLKSAS